MQTEVPSTGAEDLALNGISKVFRTDLLRGPQLAVKDLTCRFAAGRCTGLLGHNGAGKTTTIKLILGLLKSDKGSIQCGEREITTRDRAKIGYLPELNKLPALLTPREVLSYQLQMFMSERFKTAADRREAVKTALAHVNLQDHADKQIGRLSKGMARRLGWAQATIHAPSILILDEPASGLDPLARRQMIDWIGAEKKRHTTILLCTHELAQVTALCDFYHVLRRGELVASGSLGPNPAQSYTIQVSGLRADAIERFAAKEGLPPWRSLRQEGVLAELSFVGYEHSAKWLQALLAAGFVVTQFGADERAFEDALLQHYGGDV
ncbi:MAG: ABC transporter ATP-binding protein [Deltaproteobacteria bacterium]|nr:ABC transporter ATP-binding protein [Deltaproteobacteria bacterium]